MFCQIALVHEQFFTPPLHRLGPIPDTGIGVPQETILCFIPFSIFHLGRRVCPLKEASLEIGPGLP